ncbi:DNA-binding protein [Spirochaetia bacterium]|nr:DNA-binding protein [Spirochaetia bacterium]
MRDRVFIDSNIFIYYQTAKESVKKKIVDDTLDFFECIASTQVLKEICNVLSKKFSISIVEIEKFIKTIIGLYQIVLIDNDLIIDALHIHDRYSISFYDSLMVVAALKANCQYLISEDMQDGLVVDGKLTIVNIFVHTNMINTGKNNP